MNIDKIKKYNQILLAIGGTVMIIFLIFVMFMEVSRSYSYYDFDDGGGLLSSEETDILLKDSLATQVLSVNYIQLLDSTKNIYVVPITQADIEEGQKIGELLGLINSSDGFGNDYRNRLAINNLVIYSGSMRESKVLFNQRIGITDYQIASVGDDTILWILGAKTDSNKDGRINSRDMQEIFLYSVENEIIRKVNSPENYTAIDLISYSKSNDVFIKFGFDLNLNGEFDLSNEPANIYLLDKQKIELIDVVTKDQLQEIQNYIQGSIQ